MSNQWKWSEFNPKIVKTDKRDRENAVEKTIKLVMKNFNDLGLSSLASVPVIDRNRTVQKVIHVYPPNSPLESFFSNAENRKFIKSMEKAIEDTQMYALELWDLLDEGSDESKQKFIEMVGEEDDEEETVEPSNVKKPSKPVFVMTSDEVAVY